MDILNLQGYSNKECNMLVIKSYGVLVLIGIVIGAVLGII